MHYGTYQVIRSICVKSSDLDEAALTCKVHVQMFRYHRPGYSVGHVGPDQKLIAEVQQLHVQLNSFFSLPGKKQQQQQNSVTRQLCCLKKYQVWDQENLTFVC